MKKEIKMLMRLNNKMVSIYVSNVLLSKSKKHNQGNKNLFKLNKIVINTKNQKLTKEPFANNITNRKMTNIIILILIV